ncbi:unnamed protein product [Lactuca saligna]|uniref:Uncharacterized protein n=1 Tax=Lactuca saligna TaxID=75948 RepID=A0AA35Z5E7_LACSI|nr:unnamed protein product [Lactuca saligna]
MSGWRIRPQMDEINLEASYGGNPTVFSIRLHYGGEFTKFYEIKYIKGQHKFVDLIDSNLFSAHDIDDMMEELACVEEEGCVLNGLTQPQLNPPVLEPSMQTPTMKPNMESLSHIDVAHVSPPRMESPIEVEFVKEPNMEPPIMEPFSEALGGSSDNEGSRDSSDSDDSDFIVDEDNLLDDTEVDIHDFCLNIDDNLEWVGDPPITTENVEMSDEEMEVINTDVL